MSHSCTSDGPPKISAARSRIDRTPSVLDRIACSSAQAVVMMHRPSSRSHIIDSPMQPSMAWTASMTSSRTYAMPSSTEPGSAWMVVDRAYIAGRSDHLGHVQVRQHEVELGHAGDLHTDAAGELLAQCLRCRVRGQHVGPAVVGDGGGAATA